MRKELGVIFCAFRAFLRLMRRSMMERFEMHPKRTPQRAHAHHRAPFTATPAAGVRISPSRALSPPVLVLALSIILSPPRFRHRPA
jgi:hypothetical protein